MEYMGCPNHEDWQKRQEWFESKIEELQGPGSYIVSEQACALIGEVETVFCAGAWVAVIAISVSVIEAQFREVEAPNDRGRFSELIDNIAGGDERLHRLRRRRNSIVHLKPENPASRLTSNGTIELNWKVKQGKR